MKLKFVFATLLILFLTPTILVFAAPVDVGLAPGAETGLVNRDIRVTIAKIIKVILGFLGIIALVLVIYAGFMWMTAAGNPDQITKAKNILVAAAIGLIIILLSYAIVTYVMSRLLESLNNQSNTVSSNKPSNIGTRFSSGLGSGIIESHYPARNAKGVFRNTKIIITFKEEIDAKTLILDSNNNTVFGDSYTDKIATTTIKIYKTPVSASGEIDPLTDVGIVTRDFKTFILKPVLLLGSPTTSESYTVVIGKDLKKKDGETVFGGIATNYSWKFEVSTLVDNTPPQILNIIPIPDSTEPMNVVVQINFNEAIDPLSASGFVPGFDNLKIRKVDVGPVDTSVSGNFNISNQYQTIEFVTQEKCGTNSCGEEIFCLPGGAKLEALVKADTLEELGPLGKFPYDGVVDMAGNSFDGNKDGKASGQPDDNFAWQFTTTNVIDLSSPQIVSTDPPKDGSGVKLDQPVQIIFNKKMMMSSLNTKNIQLNVSGSDDVWGKAFWINSKLIVNNASPDTGISQTKTSINHDDFENNTTYSTYVLSGIKDIYQNCYIPPVQ